MPSRNALTWFGGIAFGIMALLAGPLLVARWNSPQTPLHSGTSSAEREAFPAPESCRFLLIVARRPERMGLDDPIPHRNSRVALYERTKSGWARVTVPLPIRSESTALKRKFPEDAGKSEWEKLGSYTYGYASVPLGVFTLSQHPWRDGVTPAFQISDWGRFDGLIGLHSPQVLRSLETTRNLETKAFEQSESVIRSSIKKQGSWIHYTHTERWSHGDSNGCMNLYRPTDYAGKDFPYADFLSWFRERSLEPGPEGDLVPLAVVPFEYVHEPNTDEELRVNLPRGFLDRVREFQGKQMGEIR